MSRPVDEMEFDCPECGMEFTLRLSTVKLGYKHECKSCGVLIEFSGDDLSVFGKSLVDLDKVVSSM